MASRSSNLLTHVVYAITGALLAVVVFRLFVHSDDQEQVRRMIEATQQGDAQLVRKLLSDGADPDLGNPSGWRPLHYAAFFGNREVAEALDEIPKAGERLHKRATEAIEDVDKGTTDDAG